MGYSLITNNGETIDIEAFTADSAMILMEAIMAGYNVDKILNPDYSADQLEVLVGCIEKGMDVTYVGNPDIPWYMMEFFLKSGINDKEHVDFFMDEEFVDTYKNLSSLAQDAVCRTIRGHGPDWTDYKVITRAENLRPNEISYFYRGYHDGETPIICIMGETARGKDTFARRLGENGLHAVCSYATRPMREGEVEGKEHYFVSDKEADEILKKEDIVAFTQIGEFRYFATKGEFDKSDVYVIDPKGVNELREKTDRPILLVDVSCSKRTAIERAKGRGDDMGAFKKRSEAEEEQFKDFREEGEYTKFDYHKISNEGPKEELLTKADSFAGRIRASQYGIEIRESEIEYNDFEIE